MGADQKLQVAASGLDKTLGDALKEEIYDVTEHVQKYQEINWNTMWRYRVPV